jgi:hypothetical protein
MALIDSEGFGFSTNAADYLTYGRFVTVGNSFPATLSTGGPLGDNYMQLNMSGQSGIVYCRYARTVPGTPSQIFMGVRLNLAPSYAGGAAVVFADIAGLPQCCVEFFGTTGAVIAYTGLESTALSPTSAAGVFPSSGWFYAEIGVTISNTVGAIIVRINGATVLSLSNVNTQNSRGSTIGAIEFAPGGGGNGCEIAHYYLCDTTGSAPCNTFLGDVQVQTLLPTGNDAVAFAAAGLTNNWQNAGSVPPVPGSDYNSNGTVGAQDTFNCGTIAPGLGTVYGLNVKSLLSKTDAGPRTAAGVVKSGSTTLAATAVAVSTSPEVVSGIFMTDPNTGAAWSDAAVNAAKIGYKIVS